MAITSHGYDGTVDEVGWSRLHRTGGAWYGVEGVGDWKCTVVAGEDRQIAIAPGNGWGKGVFDYVDAPVIVGPMPSVSSGSRWDLIVARRDWSTNTTSFAYVTGSALKALPTRTIGGGVLDEQPIALVRFQVGQSQAQEIVDLRVHRSIAQDVLALDYYNEPGARVRIGQYDYTRILAPITGTAAWSRVAVAPASRTWRADRTGEDSWTGGGQMTPLLTIADAPPGDYLIHGVATVRCALNATAPSEKYLIINGLATGIMQDDMPPNSVGWSTKELTETYRHPGGTLSVSFAILIGGTSASVNRAKCLVTYLGSIA